MSLRCLLGHDKEYGVLVHSVLSCKCPIASHDHQIRWVCRRCKKMGSSCAAYEGGVWKIHFGKIVADEKAWLAGEEAGLKAPQEGK